MPAAASFHESRRSTRAERILVADDEEEVREIISSMLTSAGCQCRAVAGGLEALNSLETSEKWELLLTDLLNSPMDGLTPLLRMKEKFSNMPVVVASAVRDYTVVQACIRKGACEHLFMPFEHEQLLVTVRRALEHRRMKLDNSR
jgi:DNA-binding NtrC family response regulator